MAGIPISGTRRTTGATRVPLQGGGGSLLQGGGGISLQNTGTVRQGSTIPVTTADPMNFMNFDSGAGAGDGTNNTNLFDGGGAGTVDMTAAARAATQKSIDSLDTILGNNLDSISSRFRNILDQYGEEEALNQTRFNEQTAQNENTRTSTMQAALLAAAQGGRGLRATLASLGALGGTGSLLANRAVAGEANRDMGEGNKVFDANATTLNNTWTDTQADQKRRRTEAEDARAAEEQAARAKVAQERQSLYEKMAGFWGQAGNQGEAARYLGLVGEQAPIIADTTKTQVSPYQKRNIAFDAGKLNTYLAGANDMTVKTSGGATGSAINSPLYSLTRRREELA